MAVRLFARCAPTIMSMSQGAMCLSKMSGIMAKGSIGAFTTISSYICIVGISAVFLCKE